MRRQDGTPSIVTTTTRAITFNHARKLLRWALDCGAAERIGLSRQFITAMPAAGPTPVRKRSPFPDEVARALADEASLARLAEVHDPDRLRAARHLGNDHRHRAAGQRGASAAAGLHRPLRRAGHALARPDQGRPLRPGDPHPRIVCTGRLAARRRKTPCPGSLPGTAAPPPAERAAMALFPGVTQPGRDRLRHLPVVPPPVQGLGRRARHRPLGSPSGQAHAGHQPAAARREPHPHPPLPRARLRPDGRALHPAHPFRPRGRPAARVGRRARLPQPRHAAVRPRHPGHPRAGPGARASTCPGAAPPPTAGSAPSSRSSTAAPARGTWTATTAQASCCPAPTCSTGGANASSGTPSPNAPPTTPPPSWLHDVFAPTAAAIDGLEAALAGLGLLLSGALDSHGGRL